MKAVTKRVKKEKELKPFFVILENSIVAAIFTAIIVFIASLFLHITVLVAPAVMGSLFAGFLVSLTLVDVANFLKEDKKEKMKINWN